MLYCAQGAVRVLVHRTEFSIAQGGYFLVPRGKNSLILFGHPGIAFKLTFSLLRHRQFLSDQQPDRRRCGPCLHASEGGGGYRRAGRGRRVNVVGVGQESLRGYEAPMRLMHGIERV